MYSGYVSRRDRRGTRQTSANRQTLPPWSGRKLLFASVLATQMGTMTQASAQALDQALDWTLRTNLSIRSDDARQDAATAKLRGSIDAFMPTVSFVQERILRSTISYSPEIIVPTTIGGDSTARNEPNLYGFQASLPLFDGLRRYNNFRAASIGVETGKYLQIGKRQDVLLDASTAYLAVMRDRRIVELRRKQVSDIITIAERTKARFSVRDATLTDVDLASSRVLAAQVALEQAMADLTSSNIDFNRVTGLEPQTLTPPQVPDHLIPASVEELQAVLVQSNPRLQAARLDATAAGYLAKAQFADLMPQVNLVANHLRQTHISEALDRATDTTVKVQLRVPLYEPGALPRINETAALARQKEWDALDNQKQGTAAATSLYLGRLSTITQIGRTNARINAMQKAVNGYRIEQAAGYRTIIDILNARNELTDAQVAKVNLEFARDKQTFSLAAALARLGPTQAPVAQTPPTLVSALR